MEAAELNEQHEKLVLSAECQLVTVVAVVPGLLEVTTQHIYFYDCSAERVETEEGASDEVGWRDGRGGRGWLWSGVARLSDSCPCHPSLQALAMTSGAHWRSCARSTCGVSTCAVQHWSSSLLIRPTTSSTSRARWVGLQPHLRARPPGLNPAPSHPTPRYGTRYTSGSCACGPPPKAT